MGAGFPENCAAPLRLRRRAPRVIARDARVGNDCGERANLGARRLLALVVTLFAAFLTGRLVRGLFGRLVGSLVLVSRLVSRLVPRLVAVLLVSGLLALLVALLPRLALLSGLGGRGQ